MKIVRYALVYLAATLMLLAFVPEAHAFKYWSDAVNDQGQCAVCHGAFREGNYFSHGEDIFWGDDLHAVHLAHTDVESAPNGSCDSCHGGADTSGRQVNVQSSAAAKDGVNFLGCMGCHGRLEDGAANIGAGLRKHHMGSAKYTGWPGGIPGGLNCAICHGGDPAEPASEDTAPAWYASVTNTSIMMTMNACSLDGEEDFSSNGTGQDNDGDQAYDALDSDCVQAERTPGDFNFDGKADILWRNTSTGQNWLYQMDGATIDVSAGINTVGDTNWQIVGTGDYDGNGTADILWRHALTGQNWMFLMNGSTVDSSAAVSTVSNMDWEIVGSGDYDGNGKDDILWRNTSTGQNWMYLMNGALIDSSGFVNTVSNLNWKVVASPDLDGDGKSDILLRNSSTGQNWRFRMNGMSVDASSSINTVNNPQTHVAGVGDVDADGDDDILWHNDVSGRIWVYQMNDAVIDSPTDVVTVTNTAWEIAGTNDYDGDGDADILLRNGATGQVWLYSMIGPAIDASEAVTTVSNTAWEIVRTQ